MSKQRNAIKVDLTIKGRERTLLAAGRSPVCGGCERGGKLPLSCFPIISSNRCKLLGKPDLFTNPANLPLMCPDCIQAWNNEPFHVKRELLDISKRVEFLKEHDSDRYVIFVALERKHCHATQTESRFLSGTNITGDKPKPRNTARRIKRS